MILDIYILVKNTDRGGLSHQVHILFFWLSLSLVKIIDLKRTLASQGIVGGESSWLYANR